MKCVVTCGVALVSLLVFPASLLAAPPVITGLNPAQLSTFSTQKSVGVIVYGRDFWPSGPMDPGRWSLYVRRQNLPFQTVLIGGIAGTHIEAWMDSLPLLNSPGALEFMIKRDGIASNVFSVKVTSDPPTLNPVQPDQIRIQGADEARWNLWLTGDNWVTKSTIWVDGVQVGGVFNYGRQPFTWPAGLRKIGSFGVQIRNEHGVSQTRTVQVLAVVTSLRKATTSVNVLAPTPTPPARLREWTAK